MLAFALIPVLFIVAGVVALIKRKRQRREDPPNNVIYLANYR